MGIAILGCLVLVVSVLQIRFPGLARTLKNSEPEIWEKLGSPSGYSFSDLGNTFSLYAWVLSKKFLDSEKSIIIEEGERALKKARLVRCGIIVGVALIVSGFALVLVQSIA
ncbi:MULTISPECIES: hypothetical protein [Microbulbifer]|uniref:hypothetical protein n=1 Tax=Microbulbifer TaxID=48073 RepID=UPI001E2A1CC1|nr:MULTISPECIES: hypothetical protein [Microbulbifer]UHQ54590.1 hypothetical protein LVE68_13930 [Microbulbifer sp. YPW16]